MKSYVKFSSELSEDIKERADKAFNEIFAQFKNQEPMMCSSKEDGDISFVQKMELTAAEPEWKN